MDQTLFGFIWAHSKRQQLGLLAVTVLSFPLLYASLELPKRIINDAIGGPDEPQRLPLLDVEVDRLEYLWVLCGLFLLAVLGQGLMKMQINVMKGVLAERLLRRLRYQLVSRMLRFPQPYFRRTSQGELVSMVTSEAEPLGGIMGDAVAQPVFQGGMMLTILSFLFIQNVWLGFAAIALIPLQAWLIPLLQRRVNRLNRERVIEVRRFASEIGENAAGVADLRINGGWRHRQAVISHRLGRLFSIRYRIYRLKFLMKFLNNFITQLTPFFFFAIGGYLAIRGDLTVGALVAALAAYKDLSAPWKELLAYYNQVQDMTLRWRIVMERFAPQGEMDERLFDGHTLDVDTLAGPIRLNNVAVRDSGGQPVLDGLDLEIQAGERVAILSPSAVERRALGEVLSREIAPSSGQITLNGKDLATLHQDTVAARIGYVGHAPYLFDGTVGDNTTIGLRTAPVALPDALPDEVLEARRAGNSPHPLSVEWLDPSRAGFDDHEALSDFWLRITETMGTDQYLFRRGLDAQFDRGVHPNLADRLVELRPEVARRIEEAQLGGAMHRFEEDAFNPGLPVGGNLLYATPRREISQEALADDARFAQVLREIGIEQDLLSLGLGVLGVLVRVFGADGTEHPLFRDLGIDAALFEKLNRIEATAREHGIAALDPKSRALLMTVPFRFAANRLGAPFPAPLKRRLLELRRSRGAELRERAADIFEPLAPDRFASGLTVLENAIFGKLAAGADAKIAKLRSLVGDVLVEAGLTRQVAELIADVPTGIGGAQLPQVSRERIAFVRAALKRPDILILDHALPSHDEIERAAMRARLGDLLPKTTLLFLEPALRDRTGIDRVIEIEDGRVVGGAGAARADDPDSANADLSRRIRALERSTLFADLERRHLRLLAYASDWVTARPGERLFEAGEIADAAYLLVKGQAELRWSDASTEEPAVTVVEPGRMIGDLNVLRGDLRLQDLVVTAELKALRIDGEALRKIVVADPAVAMSLLRTVSGYLIDAAGRLRDERNANRG